MSRVSRAAARRRPLRVGLTGGLGAGKSEALKVFARAGLKTLSLDALTRALYGPGRPLARALARAFGPRVLDARGGVDRRELARRVFSDRAALRRLERLAHPALLGAMRRWLAHGGGVRVADVPLLFEKGLAGEFDLTLFVDAPAPLRARRAAARLGMTLAEARRRMAEQWPSEKKRERADIVLENSGGLEEFRARALEYARAFSLIAGT